MKSEFSRRHFNKTMLGALSASMMLKFQRQAQAAASESKSVRIGFIGVGSRGKGLLKVTLKMPGVQVPAICDIDEEHLNSAVKIVKMQTGHTPEGYSKGEYDYRRMLERDDLDAVLIATPTEWHSVMTVDGLNQDKHVGCEVPAAVTLDGCWDIVEAQKKSKAQYVFLENYVYNRNNLLVYNMTRQHAFGDLYYAQCAYIHDVRGLRFKSDGSLTWRGQRKIDKFGNLYPTHSFGPVAKWMDINKTDRVVSLTSQMSKPMVLHDYVLKKFGPDHPNAKLEFKAGDMNVTLVKTEQGKLITVYYDTDSPRPHEISYLLQGTNGIYDSREGIYLESESKQKQWTPTDTYKDKYTSDTWKKYGKQAAEAGHGGSDFFTILDFVEVVKGSKEPFIDVYDAAVWSAIMPLSQLSIANGGSSVSMPDFKSNRKQSS